MEQICYQIKKLIYLFYRLTKLNKLINCKLTMSLNKIEMKFDKRTQFSEWYNNLVFDTELLEYYDISGCYIYLPYSYEIWEMIKERLDFRLKLSGVENVYFPMLITSTNLTKEQSHIDGFTPEVVWVSKTGNESEVSLAIRPTSECAFYPYYAKKIKTHADMPLKFNQWCSVMRWEFSTPTPFIRSREFLWQEGHSAFSNADDAEYDAISKLTIYKNIYEELLCVPVVLGLKVQSEKFAGAVETYTVETFIPEASRGVQCATLHYLGQNFSKIFNISFQKEDGRTDFAYQNSWGFTTRSIGVSIMMHSDNKGLILPPKIAPKQIVIVKIQNKFTDKNALEEYVKNVQGHLGEWRIHLDNSDRTPGFKFNYWEAKGIPVRIEIGRKDMDDDSVTVYRRDTGVKMSVKVTILSKFLLELFDAISNGLYDNAKARIAEKTKFIFTKEQYETNKSEYEGKLIYLRLCDSGCEDKIKNLSLGKIMCKPYSFDIPPHDVDKATNCIICGNALHTYWHMVSKTF